MSRGGIFLLLTDVERIIRGGGVVRWVVTVRVRLRSGTGLDGLHGAGCER